MGSVIGFKIAVYVYWSADRLEGIRAAVHNSSQPHMRSSVIVVPNNFSDRLSNSE
jgi:hypothetical protein